jgi:hypothetical protein
MTTPTPTTFTTSLITPAPKLVPRDNALLGYYIFSTNSSTTSTYPSLSMLEALRSPVLG